MRVRLYHSIFLLMTVTILSCYREESVEGRISAGTSATASLAVAANGTCLLVTVTGTYTAGADVNAANYLQLQVNVTATGAYSITTDTVNGYSFSATGVFTATGVQTVQAYAKGKPLAATRNRFIIRLNNSRCTAEITVQPAAANGTAGYVLQTNGTTCLDYIVQGICTAGSPLSAANTITIKVLVNSIGSYSLSTTASNGIQFSASGTFTATGVQTVILTGSGTPVNAGVLLILLSNSSGSCSIQLNIEPASSATDYFPRTANNNWTYEIDDAATDTARFFSLPSVKNSNGYNYNIFMVSTGTTPDSAGYYRKSGADYFRYMDMGDFIGFDQPLWAEYIFLKEAAAGTNWKTAAYQGTVTIAPYPPQTLIIRFSNTVLAKDISVAVTTSTGTVNYSNVIVMEEKYERFESGAWVNISPVVGSLKRYYAKNIGMIKYESISGTGSISALFELKRYQVF